MSDTSDDDTIIDFAPLPEHTCPRDNSEPSPQCPACVHAMGRFAELFYPFLDLVHEPGDDAESTDLPLIAAELSALGLAPTLWIHCACIITQLACKPVTVDRQVPALAEVIAENPGFAPAAIDKIDAMLTHVGLLDYDEANDVAIDLLNSHGDEGEWLAHLLLGRLARHHIDTHMDLWQQTVHRTLYHDMEQAVGMPSEMLTAARISGLMLEGDNDTYHQLMSRSVRDRSAAVLTRIWNHASAKYHDNIKYSIVRTDTHGVLDALINPDSALADAENMIEKGFMVAARMVKAIAADDKAMARQIKRDLEADTELVPHVIHSCCYFHAQVMYAVYHEHVEQRRLARQAATAASGKDGANDSSANDGRYTAVRPFDPDPFGPFKI